MWRKYLGNRFRICDLKFGMAQTGRTKLPPLGTTLNMPKKVVHHKTSFFYFF